MLQQEDLSAKCVGVPGNKFSARRSSPPNKNSCMKAWDSLFIKVEKTTDCAFYSDVPYTTTREVQYWGHS